MNFSGADIDNVCWQELKTEANPFGRLLIGEKKKKKKVFFFPVMH